MYSAFTPSHRGGSGPPLLCLHGYADIELAHIAGNSLGGYVALQLAALDVPLETSQLILGFTAR